MLASPLQCPETPGALFTLLNLTIWSLKLAERPERSEMNFLQAMGKIRPGYISRTILSVRRFIGSVLLWSAFYLLVDSSRRQPKEAISGLIVRPLLASIYANRLDADLTDWSSSIGIVDRLWRHRTKSLLENQWELDLQNGLNQTRWVRSRSSSSVVRSKALEDRLRNAPTEIG
jgi:hypothetical protein